MKAVPTIGKNHGYSQETVCLLQIGSEFKRQFDNAFKGVYDSRRKILYSGDATVSVSNTTETDAPMKLIVDEAVPNGVGKNGLLQYPSGEPTGFNSQYNDLTSSAALMDLTGKCVLRLISTRQIANTGVHEAIHTAQVYHPFDEQNAAEDVDLTPTGPYRASTGAIKQGFKPSLLANTKLIRTNIMNYPWTSINGGVLVGKIDYDLILSKISPDQAYQLVKQTGEDINRINGAKRPNTQTNSTSSNGQGN